MKCLQHILHCTRCDGEKLRQVALVRIREHNLPCSYSTPAAYELYPAHEMHFYDTEQHYTAA